MQLQLWEGTVLRRAESVLQRATHDTMRREGGCQGKVWRRAWLKEREEGIGWAARYRGAERAEARGVFELEKAVSYRSVDHRWRTKLDLGRGKPLDDLHPSTTLGAAIKIGGVFGGRSVLFGMRFLCRAQQLKAKGQGRGAPPVGQEAEVADAYKTFGEQVQQEAAQELVDGEGHELLLVVVSGIAPAKGDLAIGEGDQAMVGDGHAMGVAAQILQHVLGATERTFQVDHPVLSVEGP